MNTSAPPPPTRGTSRYLALAAVLLLLGGGILWFVMAPDEAPPPVAAGEPDAGPSKAGPQLGATDLLLPDDIPDAGPDEPVAEEPDEDDGDRTRRVATKSWECTGDIDRAAAARVVSENRRQVRACYERALKQNNMLQGKLVVELRIDAQGKVDGTRFSGTLRDPEVRSCVRRLTRSWRFPAPGGRRCALVSVPFDLTPRP